MKLLLSILLCTFTFVSLAAESNCELSVSQSLELLNMDYHSFDQTLPDGGWRGIANRGCLLTAAQLIDEYQILHSDELIKTQTRMLSWHAGQLYALFGLDEIAMIRFRQSLIPNERPNDDFKWNAYVNGSIAFLSRNLNDLIKYRNELQTASNPHSKFNLAILNNMIACFGKSYQEVYNGTLERKEAAKD